MVDKERALEALGHIDPELIERMEVQKKRRLPRPLRAGLIAACVCLALVGTVGAVMVGFDFVGSFLPDGVHGLWGTDAVSHVRLFPGISGIDRSPWDI